MIDCSCYNIRDEYKKLTLDEVKEIQRKSSLPYSVATFNLSGSLNIGMIIRTSVIFGARKFFIIGKKRYDKRSTVGAHNYIDIEYLSYDVDTICGQKKVLEKIFEEYCPVFVEQGGTDVKNYSFASMNTPPCIIMGNEGSGIPKEMMEMVNDRRVISISQLGGLRSLNVSAATSIVLHKVSGDLINKK